jgi:hypothetical protein
MYEGGTAMAEQGLCYDTRTCIGAMQKQKANITPWALMIGQTKIHWFDVLYKFLP